MLDTLINYFTDFVAIIVMFIVIIAALIFIYKSLPEYIDFKSKNKTEDELNDNQ